MAYSIVVLEEKLKIIKDEYWSMYWLEKDFPYAKNHLLKIKELKQAIEILRLEDIRSSGN